MKLVKRLELKMMPPGTCFVPVSNNGKPEWNEWNIISRQSVEGFIGTMPVTPFYSQYGLMEDGETSADNDTIDTRYWDYNQNQYFAVMSREELESVREAINYALECEGLK